MIATALLMATLAVSDAQPKPVLTVVYFDNNTGNAELDVLRKGLADMIITDLVAWDGVAVVEREKLEAIIDELKLQRTKYFDPATAVKLGKFVGAQYLLSGAIGAAGAELRLDARLVDLKSAGTQVVASAQVRGHKDRVFDLEQQLVDRITAGIDLKVNNLSQRRRVKVPDLDALLAYSKAIDLSDQGKLEEAQQALQAVVSKAPGFLLARERKEQVLAKLAEARKKRAGVISDSALEAGRRAEAALAAAAEFATLDEVAQGRRILMRVVRARFLARLLKQHLSTRDESFRVVLGGREAQAVAVMKAWVSNQRALVAESEYFERAYRSPGIHRLDAETDNLAGDAGFGEIEIPRGSAFPELVRFLVDGRVYDGPKHYTVAPAPGELLRDEQEAVLVELEKRIQALLAAARAAEPAQREQADFKAIILMEQSAEVFESLGRADEAIAAWQRILDAFPTARRVDYYEKRIKQLVGAEHDYSQSCRERWSKAMSDGCADDMDLRVGSNTVLTDRMRRMGLAALAAHAAEMEKACKPNSRNRGGMAAVYHGLASEAAQHDDCEAYRRWSAKYVEAGGSVSDLFGYQKNYTPWCELGDVVKSVMWLHSKLDQNWDLEMNRNLTSVLSYDGKMLSFNGGREGTTESLHFTLEADGKGGFACTRIQWHRLDRSRLEGTCEVKLKAVAQDRGGYDEGEFSAEFATDEGSHRRTIRLTEGRFRVRRQ